MSVENIPTLLDREPTLTQAQLTAILTKSDAAMNNQRGDTILDPRQLATGFASNPSLEMSKHRLAVLE